MKRLPLQRKSTSKSSSKNMKITSKIEQNV
jgi:hypothetical protein